jgi:TfoX/Sxy family transcriptional regulator of competence genes
MAYDEGLAERIRSALDGRSGISEKLMFGGVCFLANGKMCCGVVKDELMVRVGPDRHEEALSQVHARPMDFTGRSMKGFVFVAPEGLESDQHLEWWVGLGVAHAQLVARTDSPKGGLARPPKNGSTTGRLPSPDRRIGKLLASLRAKPNTAPSVAAFESSAAAGGRKFGSNGLKVGGKLYALFTQGTLVVKLPEARVIALSAAGVGKPFDPGHGRLMREWLTVTNRRASWAGLATEAHDFVSGTKSAKR